LLLYIPVFRAQLDKLAANTSYAEEEFYSAFRSAMGLNPTDDVYSFRLADKIITNENKLSWATYIAEDKMTVSSFPTKRSLNCFSKLVNSSLRYSFLIHFFPTQTLGHSI